MRAFQWVRQQRGRCFGLKAHASPGYSITHWVAKDKNGWWQIDGHDMAGVVWGQFKTSQEAMREVERRLGLEGKVCAQCGSPMVQGAKP